MIAMLFYVGYNAVYTVTCYASGVLADRFPKKWVLAIGYSLAVIPALALMLPEGVLRAFRHRLRLQRPVNGRLGDEYRC